MGNFIKKNKTILIICVIAILIVILIFCMNKSNTKNSQNTYNQSEKTINNVEMPGPKEPEEDLGETIETPSKK